LEEEEDEKNLTLSFSPTRKKGDKSDVSLNIRSFVTRMKKYILTLVYKFVSFSFFVLFSASSCSRHMLRHYLIRSYFLFINL